MCAARWKSMACSQVGLQPHLAGVWVASALGRRTRLAARRPQRACLSLSTPPAQAAVHERAAPPPPLGDLLRSQGVRRDRAAGPGGAQLVGQGAHGRQLQPRAGLCVQQGAVPSARGNDGGPHAHGRTVSRPVRPPCLAGVLRACGALCTAASQRACTQQEAGSPDLPPCSQDTAWRQARTLSARAPPVGEALGGAAAADEQPRAGASVPNFVTLLPVVRTCCYPFARPVAPTTPCASGNPCAARWARSAAAPPARTARGVCAWMKQQRRRLPLILSASRGSGRVRLRWAGVRWCPSPARHRWRQGAPPRGRRSL